MEYPEHITILVNEINELLTELGMSPIELQVNTRTYHTQVIVPIHDLVLETRLQTDTALHYFLRGLQAALVYLDYITEIDTNEYLTRLVGEFE